MGYNVGLANVVFRAWYYFRIGYSTYFAFIIAGANLLVTVYYLAIRNIPALQLLFESFTVFAVTVLLAGVPLAVFTGWLHLKRSPAWRTELDIGAEANPYNYRLPPGYWMEVFAPLYLELLTLTSRLAERQGALTEEEKAKTQELQKRLETLMAGGFVGVPKRSL